jgi:hypothetical protein
VYGIVETADGFQISAFRKAAAINQTAKVMWKTRKNGGEGSFANISPMN